MQDTKQWLLTLLKVHKFHVKNCTFPKFSNEYLLFKNVIIASVCGGWVFGYSDVTMWVCHSEHQVYQSENNLLELVLSFLPVESGDQTGLQAWGKLVGCWVISLTLHWLFSACCWWCITKTMGSGSQATGRCLWSHLSSGRHLDLCVHQQGVFSSLGLHSLHSFKHH